MCSKLYLCVCVCIDTTYGRVPDKSCFMKVFNILLEFTNSSSISSHPLMHAVALCGKLTLLARQQVYNRETGLHANDAW